MPAVPKPNFKRRVPKKSIVESSTRKQGKESSKEITDYAGNAEGQETAYTM